MGAHFDHTIVHSRDSRASAAFLAGILGRPAPRASGPFQVVELEGGASLDFIDVGDYPFVPQHYAFRVLEEELERALARVRERDLPFWGDPHKGRPGERYEHEGDRGFYFDDPDGHLLEVLARPPGRGAGPAAAGSLRAIGVVRSRLTRRSDAPKQGSEGAPDAWVEFDPAFAEALDGIAAGSELILLSWLHQGDRSVLRVRPRRDPKNPITGVFNTRSPDRPNPIGLHRVRVLEVADATRLHVEPLEVVDRTPVVDVKPVLPGVADA